VRSLADAVAKVFREHEMKKNSGERAARQAQLAAVGAAAGVLAGGGDGAAAAGAAAGTVDMFAPKRMESTSSSLNLADICPDCGNASLRFIEGCEKCEICGFSKC
jgi:hypothetical protein